MLAAGTVGSSIVVTAGVVVGGTVVSVVEIVSGIVDVFSGPTIVVINGTVVAMFVVGGIEAVVGAKLNQDHTFNANAPFVIIHFTQL